jgi:hypothetical protein
VEEISVVEEQGDLTDKILNGTKAETCPGCGNPSRVRIKKSFPRRAEKTE